MSSLFTQHGDINGRGRQTVSSLLADQIIGSAVYWQSVGSTNAEAMRDQQHGQNDQLPCLYFTDCQSSGRGRHGRNWQSSDRNLAFSIAINWQLKQDQASDLLSIAVGVGIARALEFECAPIRSRLKWPNDIYIDAGKVGGVLIESQPAAHRLVIGIGLNVGHAPTLSELHESDGQARATAASSLSKACGRTIDKYVVLEAVVTQVLNATKEVQQSAGNLLDDFRSRCVLTGNHVNFISNGKPTVGLCKGISDSGDLVVDVAGRLTHCRSGEANQVRTIG